MIESWLMGTLPPESGPYLVWASAHLDVLRPLILAAALGWLGAVGYGLRAVGWWR